MTAARDIVWIASYPKSGNTWVRFMLSNLLFGPQSSASFLSQLIPDVHELPAGVISGLERGLLKTHFMYSASLPLASRTAGCIYIVRHPADVLLSNFHYTLRAGGGEATQAALDRYAEEFIGHRGDPRWIRAGMGCWDEHLSSWLGTRLDFPVLYLKYEDLLQDPRSGCERMSRFLGTGASPGQIDTAVSNSTFSRMREIEEADIRAQRVGIFYKPYLADAIRTGRRFMRAGVSGEAGQRLDDAQRTRLADVWSSQLAQLQYPAS